MSSLVTSLLAVVLAYLLGSIPFAVVSSRIFGLADPRSYGSKNPGATNVLRSGNKAAAALTLFGDLAKGWLAVFVAHAYGPANGFNSEFIGLVAMSGLPIAHGLPGSLGPASKVLLGPLR